MGHSLVFEKKIFLAFACTFKYVKVNDLLILTLTFLVKMAAVGGMSFSENILLLSIHRKDLVNFFYVFILACSVFQKSFQDFANETGQHVVEYRVDRRDFPRLVASPSKDNKSDFVKDYQFDFEAYCFGDKLLLQRTKKKKLPKDKQRKVMLNVNYKRRNQKYCKMERMMLGLERPYKTP